MLEGEEGQLIQKHEEKEAALWNAYKKRLGTSEYSHMYFDLQELMSALENLEVLEEPFTKAEKDTTIHNLPSDKSPGPNGFNGEFLKRCWSVVANDFYALCQGFYDGKICTKSINASHIVLVPKKDNPKKIADFRPISLLNSSVKLLTKLLANRLQKVILKIIYKNQYGFLKE
jgi:hypothetical protein